MADGLIKIQGSTNVGKCVDTINDNFEYLDGKTPAGEDIQMCIRDRTFAIREGKNFIVDFMLIQYIGYFFGYHVYY